MRFFLIRNSYVAQIEASAIIGFRVGGTCFGLAMWPPKKSHRSLLRGLYLTLWSETGVCGQRIVFKLWVLGHQVGYMTYGEAKDQAHFRHSDAGWVVR